ncbi:MAG: DNA-binding CsgD family transcriptional regulator, partial [Phycisphaerales bacterium]
TPTWTIAHALGFPLELDLHNLAGQWIPGLIDPTSNSAPSPPLGGEGGPQGRMRGSPLPAAGAERGFACRHCWNIQRVSLATNSGWNRFITHLSAGLLYGCEVPRPALANPESSRKRPYQPRPRLAADPHPRRTQAAHLFTQGLTHKQIANALSITPAAVATHIKRSHKQHNTHNRQQLKAALSTPTAHTSDA